MCSVFGWTLLTPPETLWLWQTLLLMFPSPLSEEDSCEQRLQCISSVLFSIFPFLSYLLLPCLHLSLYLPSSLSSPPLLKRLSSAMRWRSYRPLSARLLNCQQLWDERISLKLSIMPFCILLPKIWQTDWSKWDDLSSSVDIIVPVRLCWIVLLKHQRVFSHHPAHIQYNDNNTDLCCFSFIMWIWGRCSTWGKRVVTAEKHEMICFLPLTLLIISGR